ncbi:MAG: hypothetical protein PWQ55_904 [Chloroflexota bacterium]|nr:hypothetical protein [Chloroflexota bacterium]
MNKTGRSDLQPCSRRVWFCLAKKVERSLGLLKGRSSFFNHQVLVRELLKI